jgi:hypothetical protein
MLKSSKNYYQGTYIIILWNTMLPKRVVLRYGLTFVLDRPLWCLEYLCSLFTSLFSHTFFCQSIVFFSHNKSANSNFSHDFSDQRCLEDVKIQTDLLWEKNTVGWQKKYGWKEKWTGWLHRARYNDSSSPLVQHSNFRLKAFLWHFY